MQMQMQLETVPETAFSATANLSWLYIIMMAIFTTTAMHPRLMFDMFLGLNSSVTFDAACQKVAEVVFLQVVFQGIWMLTLLGLISFLHDSTQRRFFFLTAVVLFPFRVLRFWREFVFIVSKSGVLGVAQYVSAVACVFFTMLEVCAASSTSSTSRGPSFFRQNYELTMYTVHPAARYLGQIVSAGLVSYDPVGFMELSGWGAGMNERFLKLCFSHLALCHATYGCACFALTQTRSRREIRLFWRWCFAFLCAHLAYMRVIDRLWAEDVDEHDSTGMKNSHAIPYLVTITGLVTSELLSEPNAPAASKLPILGSDDRDSMQTPDNSWGSSGSSSPSGMLSKQRID